MTQKTLKGGKELMAFLDAFPKRLQKGAMRVGVKAAAQVIQKEARARVPVETGKLRKAIKTSNPRAFRSGDVVCKVYLRGDHAYLGNWVEYGTKAHFISAGDSGKSARLLTRQADRSGMSDGDEPGALRIGNNYVSGAVHHPGQAAHPFMRPALDMRADDAVTAFGERIRKYMRDKTGFTAPSLGLDED